MADINCIKYNRKAVLFNIVFTSLAISILFFVMIYAFHLSKNNENLKDYLITTRVYQKQFMAESSINKIRNVYEGVNFTMLPNSFSFFDYFGDNVKMNNLQSDLNYFKNFIEPKTGLIIDYKFTTNKDANNNQAYHILTLNDAGSSNFFPIKHYYNATTTKLNYPVSQLSSIKYEFYYGRCNTAPVIIKTTPGTIAFPVTFKMNYIGGTITYVYRIDTTQLNTFKITCGRNEPPNTQIEYITTITIDGNTPLNKISYQQEKNPDDIIKVISTYTFPASTHYFDVYNDFGVRLFEKQQYDLPPPRIYTT